MLLRRCMLLLVCLGLFVAPPGLAAAPKPAAVFGDRMVLQRGRPLNIWGTAVARERVTVEFAGQTKTTTADADGHWSVTLEPLKANATPQDLVLRGKDSSTVLHKLLIGDVWLCGGQSNMAMTLRSTVNRDLEIGSADFLSLIHI